LLLFQNNIKYFLFCRHFSI